MNKGEIKDEFKNFWIIDGNRDIPDCHGCDWRRVLKKKQRRQ